MVALFMILGAVRSIGRAGSGRLLILILDPEGGDVRRFPLVQGGPSGRGQPFVDFKLRVAF